MTGEASGPPSKRQRFKASFQRTLHLNASASGENSSSPVPLVPERIEAAQESSVGEGGLVQSTEAHESSNARDDFHEVGETTGLDVSALGPSLLPGFNHIPQSDPVHPVFASVLPPDFVNSHQRSRLTWGVINQLNLHETGSIQVFGPYSADVAGTPDRFILDRRWTFGSQGRANGVPETRLADEELSKAWASEFLNQYLQAPKRKLQQMDADVQVRNTELDTWAVLASGITPSKAPMVDTVLVDDIYDQVSTQHSGVGGMSNMTITMIPPLNWRPTDLERAWAQRVRRNTARGVLPNYLVYRLEPEDSSFETIREQINPYISCLQPPPTEPTESPEVGPDVLSKSELEQKHAETKWGNGSFEEVSDIRLKNVKWSLVTLNSEGKFTDQEVTEGTVSPHGVGVKVILEDTMIEKPSWTIRDPDNLQPPQRRIRRASPEIMNEIKYGLLCLYTQMAHVGSTKKMYNAVLHPNSYKHNGGTRSLTDRWTQEATSYAGLRSSQPPVAMGFWGQDRSEAQVEGYDPAHPEEDVSIHRMQVTVVAGDGSSSKSWLR